MTVGLDTPTAAQIADPESPCAEERTILARSTTRCGVVLLFAALKFLDVLEPGDEAAVVDFNDRVHLPREFTSQRARLAEAIEAAFSSGGTALYDAIWKSARLLEGFDDRRVLVLLSDGRDECESVVSFS